MTNAPRNVVIEVANAVERQHGGRQPGDLDDVLDLLALWVHIHGNPSPASVRTPAREAEPSVQRRSPCERANRRAKQRPKADHIGTPKGTPTLQSRAACATLRRRACVREGGER